ncbi:mannose-6-phosphate isomerase [Bifidobacterium dolichotidis]|uniref:Mannose-6-phosphate isomerase n=1 Tax=Bifidobacterium dolichotidis TaxID=2306976 RepID=A0A430FQ23_9BIFI|nr:type I phosphomannose isomerase catalytic subunit [Bifidobacterium dolichotidis]RSX54915.1 mannose-6-phosphate isomerase [Bifidobacterium dolichotidis]
MYTIHPVPKHYAWGSHDRLQHLFDLPPQESEGPLAEMWFSGHTGSASMLEMPSPKGESTLVSVPTAIVHDPLDMVGHKSSDEFGPVLPYLFKIICAREPLSLQVHPIDFEARAGFNEENARGIALDDPTRSFKDTNAKNEMVVALEPFMASVGFSTRNVAMKNLALVNHPVALRMLAALQSTNEGEVSADSKQIMQTGLVDGESHDLDQSESTNFGAQAAFDNFQSADVMMPVASSVWHLGMKRIFRAFHAAITAGPVDAQLLLDALQAGLGKATATKQILAFEYAIRAATAFPGDASALALLMMNPVLLDEGDSVFIPTGTPHAYIHGMGAEIMTNSDNVLRAGLTVKHKDIEHLLKCLNCKPSMPIDPSDTRVGRFLTRDMVVYRPHVNEFMLVYGRVDAQHTPWPVLDAMAKRYDAIVRQVSGHPTLPHLGPRIVMCTQGAVKCVTERDTRVLHQGEAVFVPASDGWLSVDPVTDSSADSTGSFVAASTPF